MRSTLGSGINSMHHYITWHSCCLGPLVNSTELWSESAAISPSCPRLVTNPRLLSRRQQSKRMPRPALLTSSAYPRQVATADKVRGMWKNMTLSSNKRIDNSAVRSTVSAVIWVHRGISTRPSTLTRASNSV